jgi:transcriptional regulator with XRE-family HTH domain
LADNSIKMMHTVYMADRVGPAGKVLAANISRIRKYRGLTFAEVSARTEEIGQPIAVLGLRRIERAERRVDFDDLLTLAIALRTAPADLMVPAGTDTVPYPIGSSEYGSETVYQWIAGRGAFRQGDRRLVSPAPYPRLAELEELLSWLPEDRRQTVLRDWVREQYPNEGGEADQS